MRTSSKPRPQPATTHPRPDTRAPAIAPRSSPLENTATAFSSSVTLSFSRLRFRLVCPHVRSSKKGPITLKPFGPNHMKMPLVTRLMLAFGIFGIQFSSLADSLSSIGGFVGNASRDGAINSAVTEKDKDNRPYYYRVDAIENPTRLVGKNVCDLRPLFAWIYSPVAGRNPMPAWHAFSQFEIARHLENGSLLITKTWYTHRANSLFDDPHTEGQIGRA